MRFDTIFERVRLDQEPERNILLIDGRRFFLENIDVADARGANSSVFQAVARDGDEEYVVKFCRFMLDAAQLRKRRRIERFEREITALTHARDSEFADFVIRIISHGETRMPVLARNKEEWLKVRGQRARLRYYVMQKADSDLRSFLRNTDLNFPSQIALCNDLLGILKKLHALGIYHRDIKAGNILMLGGRPVFGDLGLIAHRNEDQDFDEFDERIGPIGLLSPEATNKHLGLRGKESFAFDCQIDDKSDIFQLGQVFWLVLQSEVPTGHLTDADVRFPRLPHVLSTVIHPMLQYGKPRRADLAMVELALQPVLKELALI